MTQTAKPNEEKKILANNLRLEDALAQALRKTLEEDELYLEESNHNMNVLAAMLLKNMHDNNLELTLLPQ